MLSEERGIAASAAVYAPGTSPFHVRGSAYGSALKHAEEHVAGGLDRVQRGLFGSRAPSIPRSALRRLRMVRRPADGSALGADRGASWGWTWSAICSNARENTRAAIWPGLYRLLMRAVSARTVALFLPKLTARYHDWGGIDARLRGPRCVETVRSGVPQPLAAWYSTVACAFAETALEIAGAPGRGWS